MHRHHHVFGRLAATSAILLIAVAGCVSVKKGEHREVGQRLAWTPEACGHARVDQDRDGLDDGCELALAAAFAPVLVLDERDCLWERGASTPSPGAGFLFAARQVARGVRLAFLPAYFRDCGWTGAPCVTRGRGCGAHAGDSELVIVDVEWTATRRWQTSAVFLSAHCFGHSDGRCRWYRGAELEAFAWADGIHLGAPLVWVAKGKHANYPSRAACESGHWYYDTCRDNGTTLRFPVRSPLQNIGSRQHPLPPPTGCVSSDQLTPRAASGGIETRECPWDATTPFRGWQTVRDGSPPASYARYLARFGEF